MVWGLVGGDLGLGWGLVGGFGWGGVVVWVGGVGGCIAVTCASARPPFFLVSSLPQ